MTSIEAGRKFTITEEYFSLTALLGNVFMTLDQLDKTEAGNIAFLIPQNEGTETDGQYSRLLRTKLDEEGYENVDIVSPFWEDILLRDDKTFHAISLTLIAGDIVWSAPRELREKYVSQIVELVHTDQFDIEHLQFIAQSVALELNRKTFDKSILLLGECNILFDEMLNNYTFKDIESKGHRVLYSPFSEAMWMMWRDYADQNKNDQEVLVEQRLQKFESDMQAISNALSEWSCFAVESNDLIRTADRTLGYYSGAHARYRQAKQMSQSSKFDAVMTAASIYENTGIVLGMLQKGFEDEETKPVLNLTFDGNENENDQMKVESFIYYL